MATAQETLKLLVDARDAFSAESLTAAPDRLAQIEICNHAIHNVVFEIVRSDMNARTGQIQELSKEMKGYTADLKALKANIEAFVAAGAFAGKTLNALMALLPFI